MGRALQWAAATGACLAVAILLMIWSVPDQDVSLAVGSCLSSVLGHYCARRMRREARAAARDG